MNTKGLVIATASPASRPGSPGPFGGRPPPESRTSFEPDAETLARGIYGPLGGGYREASDPEGPSCPCSGGSSAERRDSGRVTSSEGRQTSTMGKVGHLGRLLAVSAAGAATLLIATVSGAAPGTGASVSTFDQCANGGPPSTATDCPGSWINGTLNSNNSHYGEDDVTPQRVILELPKSSPTTGRSVEISYLTRKGGVHAYDSLATWNHTQTSADRCSGIPAGDCVPGPASTFPIPLDPTVVADKLGPGSATSAHQLGGELLTMYGGTITRVSVYSHDDAAGSSDSYAHVTVTYSVPSTADGAKVMPRRTTRTR